MSFDRRTRTVDQIVPVDIGTFHRETLPAVSAERRALAARALAASDLDGFTVAVDGEAWTWGLDAAGGLEVVPGDTGDHPRADLDAEWFSDIVNDVRSAVAVMIANEPVMARGRIGHLINWEPTLRALVDGREAWEPGVIDFVDRDGLPLDLHRSFTLDDDPAELNHFLGQAGFLHVRNVFTAAEIDRLGTEMDRWFAQMSPEDDRAWYARTTDDERVCVRVTNLPKEELDFPFGERLAPVAALSGDPDRRYAGSDLLLKPVGVTAGISDLPWHKDCELGGHSYRCAAMIVGTSLTPSGPDNGQLGVLAGSHRLTVTMFDIGRTDLPELYLSTEPGDITVHLSCVLHCATSPQHSARRVTYSGLVLPGDTSLIDRKIKAVRDQAGRDTYAPA